MHKTHLLVVLIIIILLSCKKVTDPIVEQNAINGSWVEEYTWFNKLECINPEDDSANCIVSQRSTLKLYKSKFSVQITPHINNPLGIFDTLYTGVFWIRSDTIFFDSDSFHATQKMSYQLSEDSLSLELLYENEDGRTTLIPCCVFVWGNAIDKISGTFHRKK